jgi:MFS family permease
VSAGSGVPALAPFRVRSFRFQWPADIATSWAFEMENLILSWYVLVETQSVVMFTVFASLQYIGTLLAPMFGVMGDRVGHRNLLCAMRGLYAALAAALLALIAAGALTPVLVLVVAALTGLVRPSDIGMRYALIGETMPGGYLMGAMGMQRTTQDSARIAGALSGAGLVAALGMGWTYLIITALYAASLFLTFRAGRGHASAPARPDAAPQSARPSPWRDLREGAVYVWNTPSLLAVMTLAFLLNATAFLQFNNLLPVVAKEVYGGGQTLLGALVASGASGALLGAIVLTKIGGKFHAGRMMIVGCMAWYAALLVFAQVAHPTLGMFVLFLGGIAQTAGLIPMATILMRDGVARFRGRVMGIRMLAIYGTLPGLLIAGPLIASVGYPGTATLYCAIGLLFTLLIAAYWRGELWGRAASARGR